MTPKRTALVYDSGDFTHFAQAIAPGFAKTLYFSPWMSSHPHQRDTLVGNIPGLERVNWFEKYVDRADVIIFLDCGDGDYMAWLRKKGYRVWGCGLSDNLELDRINYRKVLQRLALPVVPAKEIVGIDELEKYLKTVDRCWIKCSFFRGDFESFHHKGWFTTQTWFEEKKRKLGPGGESFAFLCEEETDGIEPGYDGYCIDGQFPSIGFWGWEYKNRAYAIRWQRMADMPPAVRIVDALGPDLKLLGMRGNFHTEHRITDDGEVYITDPATRLGSPPGELMGMMIGNWADIIYQGAGGVLVEPEPRARYGAQIVHRSDFAMENYVAFEIPEDVASLFRFRRAYQDDKGTYWHVPDDHLDQVGSSLGFGDSPQEAIAMAKAVAEKIVGYEVDFAPDADTKLLSLIKDGAEKAGIYFGEYQGDEVGQEVYRG